MIHWKAMVVTVALLAIAGAVAAQDNRGALIIRDDVCLLVDGNGNVVLVPANLQEVRSPSGNASVKCTAQGVTPAADGSTKVFTFADLGIECGVETITGELVFTQNYRMVITRSGVANLSCEFNAHR